MGKKVFELAKILNLTAKEVQRAAMKLGIQASPLKALSEEEEQAITESLKNSKEMSTDAGAGKTLVRRRRAPVQKQEPVAESKPEEKEKEQEKETPAKTTAPKSARAKKTIEAPSKVNEEAKVKKAEEKPSKASSIIKVAKTQDKKTESAETKKKPAKIVIEDSSTLNQPETGEAKKATISIKASAPGPSKKKESAKTEKQADSPKPPVTPATPEKTVAKKTKNPPKAPYTPAGRTEVKVIARKFEFEEAMENFQSKKSTGGFEEATRGTGIDTPKNKKTGKQKYFFDDFKDRPKRKTGKWNPSDDEEGYISGKNQRKKKDKVKHTFNPRRKDIVISEKITVSDLAGMTGIKAGELIKSLMNMGVITTINNLIDGETAQIILTDFGIDVKVEKKKQLEELLTQDLGDNPENFSKRPPVITVMGHVDHGKTSLLDKIRSSDVAGGEAGGITQHIAAYHVETKQGMVTFLDTPGHEAFTAMRARGANATDIVILVVAADDGPMPQTVEAINHSKAAEVPILVAINKCDKPSANPEKTMQQLMEHGLVAEEYGGDCTMVKVSAQSGSGIDELLEMALLQAETMDLKASTHCAAQGVVIESEISKGRGNIVTVLVQQGVIKIGDYLLAGIEYGRVRSLINDRGKTVQKVTPGFPVSILGLNGLPSSGEKFHVLPDERSARQIAEERRLTLRETEVASTQKVSMENIFKSINETEALSLNVIIKGDVIGSVEAVRESLSREGNEKVSVNILHSSVGAISSSDVTLATASQAIILGFNVRPDANAKRNAQESGVEIRLYSVIYDIIEDVRNALVGMLEPVFREEYLGKAEVLEIFNIPKIGVVAGCRVVEGKAVRDAYVRVLRDNIVIHEGRLASLKRFKDDAKEVREGFECGFSVESYKNLQAGDLCEFVYKSEIKPTLEAP